MLRSVIAILILFSFMSLPAVSLDSENRDTPDIKEIPAYSTDQFVTKENLQIKNIEYFENCSEYKIESFVVFIKDGMVDKVEKEDGQEVSFKYYYDDERNVESVLIESGDASLLVSQNQIEICSNEEKKDETIAPSEEPKPVAAEPKVIIKTKKIDLTDSNMLAQLGGNIDFKAIEQAFQDFNNVFESLQDEVKETGAVITVTIETEEAQAGEEQDVIENTAAENPAIIKNDTQYENPDVMKTDVYNRFRERSDTSLLKGAAHDLIENVWLILDGKEGIFFVENDAEIKAILVLPPKGGANSEEAEGEGK